MGRKKKLINNSGIPQHEIEHIARCILPDILADYESAEGQREFREWQAQRESDSGLLTTPFWQCASSNYPKKTNNPNPSPTENRFGLFFFGTPHPPKYEPVTGPGLVAGMAENGISAVSVPSVLKKIFKWSS